MRPKRRGAGPPSCARDGSRTRSARSVRRSRRPSRRAASGARRSPSIQACAARSTRCRYGPSTPIRICSTSYTHHASVSVQRQLTRNISVEASYIGKIGTRSRRAQLFQRRAVHQLAHHRSAPVAAERRATGAAQSGDHQRTVARARELLPEHIPQPAAEGRAPLCQNLLVLRTRTRSRRT